MKLYSFVRQDSGLSLVEVEVVLIPGLPQLQCLGLPDQHIRESTHRIRSALKKQAFEFPKGRQVIVNLKPSHLKKTSCGLEFAIAAGILWETGQLPHPGQEGLILYGELSLQGEVTEPDDLIDYAGELKAEVWTGEPQSHRCLHFHRRVFSDLKSLALDASVIEASPAPKPQRPQGYDDFQLSREAARLISIVAIGEHPTLLLGPAGSGKSTLSIILQSLLEEPTALEFRRLRHRARQWGESLDWRPLIKPHHSTTARALIGGGGLAGEGEISRADGGVLLLDEFFEFNSKALEALREPMEEGQIRLARGGRVRCLPTDSIIMGTGNLCPCGDWVPGHSVQCSYSLRKCQSYIERMSGPLLDRFHILSFSHEWKSKEQLCVREVSERLSEVRSWKKKNGLHPCNAKASPDECLTGLDEFSRQHLLPRFSSRRREQATFRVARSIADLDLSLTLESRHIEAALHWTQRPYLQLKSWS